MAFATVAASVGVADDAAKGIMDRFRSLPMARSAVLVGHTAFLLLRALFGLFVLAACGLAVGWCAHEGVGPTLAAFGLLLLFQLSMIWVGAFIGLLVRTPETADSATFAWFFPLTFVANTFVPTQGMPVWLRAIADWNPMSATTAACRGLFGNPNPPHTASAWALQHPVLASVGWSLLILAVFVPLAVGRYRAAGSR
jgi:ABC-type multidrug transport system permease subunit